MASGRLSVVLVLVLVAVLANAQEYLQTSGHPGLSSCYNDRGVAQKCLPEFENAAYDLEIKVNNTCGENGETEFCVQTDTSTTKSCDVCTPGRFQPYFLTDFHHERENITWWMSETMNEGIQYPNSVVLDLNLGRAYEITYIRVVFYSPRPESFAIYKKTKQDGPWIPYQYYSASCRDMYNLPESTDADRGAETRALCTSEYSDISPLRGGNVPFATLSGRPSAVSFDTSPELQEWVTATDIRIVLNRLNTFGEEVFRDQKVLQSYWYAIADIAIGARCKCNGHASKCEKLYRNGVREKRCVCEHNTDGPDCEKCLDFFNDAPWGRASPNNAHECKPCNCNGYSKICKFDKELYERTGHGGHCLNCTQNRDGPNCERCKENYYQRKDNVCISCDCDVIGSRSLQCNSEGKCQCKPGVTGFKCDRCASNFFQFTNQGCKPCLCNEAGSFGNSPNCDPETGICHCKENVEGRRCRECKPGYFNLDVSNEFGCTPCFCYGHSAKCQSAPGYSKVDLGSYFIRNNEKWTAQDGQRKTIGLKYNGHDRSISVTSPSRENVYFIASDQFLGDQRASYNHDLKFVLHINESSSYSTLSDLVLEGGDAKIEIPIIGQGNQNPSTQKNEYVFRLHEHPKYEWSPGLRHRQFIAILSNLTSIRLRGTYNTMGTGILENFRIETAYRGAAGHPATWIEMCTCPKGFVGQFCESCAPGYRHSPALGGPFKPCIPCDCNKHAEICDSETGRCICEHNTAGANCEFCAKGYYGNALAGTSNDCKECPCPQKSACIQLKDSIVCTECPTGYAGSRCEGCSDGYFGDPTGKYGNSIACKLCECNQNIDMNAVANCNQTTGECLKCIYNTAGPSCELCLPGYYGDALAPTKGDCRQCECYRMGTWEDDMGISQCDRISGQCKCKPHVHGRNCDKCQDGYYNIMSGEGCQSCNCNFEGSYNNTCHPTTGQCHCRTGITGLQCDKCKPYQYGFSSKGCKECMCDPIGSKGLQCDSSGQCPCYENVEGLRCDMCKENKHDKQKGCIDCDPCYNLVQDAVNVHRDKLRRLEKLLLDIEKSPTVIKDSDFDDNLAAVKYQIDDLIGKTNAITGDSGKTIVEELREFSNKLENIRDRLKKINESADDALESTNNASNTIKDVKETLDSLGKEIDNAFEYLQIDGSKALAKAQNRSDQFGQQSTQMSQIAQESRLLAEKYEREADNIKNIAEGARKTANETYQLAKSGLGQQTNISNELRLLDGEMSAAVGRANDVQTKATESLRRASQANKKSLEIYAHIENLDIPNIDVKQTKNDVDEIIFEASNIKDKIEKLMISNDDVLQTIENEIKKSQVLLNQSTEQQSEIQDTLLNLDIVNKEAETAINSINEKYKEAKKINETLKEFHNKVQTSREEALSAKNKIPVIIDKISNITQAKETLERAEENAKQAKKIAEDALVFANNASEAAKVARDEIISALDAAKGFHNEAEQLPGRIDQSENKIEENERKNEKNNETYDFITIKVQQVKHDVEQTEKEVKKGLDEVTKIIDSLKILKSLNDTDLDLLVRRIDDAEKEINRANLKNQTDNLQKLKNEHQRWFKDYNDEIKKLEADVRNVKEIADSLPNKCFRQIKLEP